MSYVATHVRINRGFTLTELAIVLGIMGTILGAIWVASSRVSDNNKAQKAATDVQMILAGYRSIFSTHKVDTGAGWVDMTCLGINAGAFPSDMLAATPPVCSSGWNFTNAPSGPWPGSTVYVRGVQSNNGIAIEFDGLTTAACIALVTAQNNAPDLLTVNIGGNSGVWVNPPNIPIPTSLINQYCSAYMLPTTAVVSVLYPAQ